MKTQYMIDCTFTNQQPDLDVSLAEYEGIDHKDSEEEDSEDGEEKFL